MDKNEARELLKEIRDDARRKERRNHLVLVLLGIPLSVVVFFGVLIIVTRL